MNDYLQIGKIVKTHGTKGEVKVIPLTDNIERFKNLQNIFIEKEGVLEQFHILSYKNFKNNLIIKFESINNMDEASKLMNKFLLIHRKHSVKPEGSHFICDIIGCNVYLEDESCIGQVKDVIKTGSNDVYVVKDEMKSKEILVPALKSVVKKISIEERKIVVVLPEGLEL